MKQYLDLLRLTREEGTYKPAARENMPGTISLFGEQYRCKLKDGFPLLTTKKVSFKNIKLELLWFLKGYTNVKYLNDQNCNIWNEDAYKYYLKLLNSSSNSKITLTFNEFVTAIKENITPSIQHLPDGGYQLGDCGEQYGRLWTHWKKDTWIEGSTDGSGINDFYLQSDFVNQLQDLVNGLLSSPMGRRHIITAWNPATLDDMALNACHSFAQFNCRPLSYLERCYYLEDTTNIKIGVEVTEEILSYYNIPKYHIDCKMYQRSADSILGVPYNTASYPLFLHIIAKMCNMVVGDFIHTFGDFHIYENHQEAVKTQLQREPRKLPTLTFSDSFLELCEEFRGPVLDITTFFSLLTIDMFQLENYDPYPAIQADLSTGLKK